MYGIAHSMAMLFETLCLIYNRNIFPKIGIIEVFLLHIVLFLIVCNRRETEQFQSDDREYIYTQHNRHHWDINLEAVCSRPWWVEWYHE